MKNFVKILIVVVSVLLILPKYFGSLVETEHQTTLEQWSQNPAINIVEKSFTANWFGGTASTELMVLLQDDSLDDISIVVEENLSFGPLIFANDGFHFALSHSQANINFVNLMDMDPELKAFIKDKVHVSSLFTFSKNVISKVVIDEVVKTQGGNEFHFNEAISEFTLTKDDRVYGEFNWAGMNFASNGDEVKVEGVSFKFDQALIAGDYSKGNAIVTGYFDFVIASISASDKIHNNALLIENLYMKGESKVKDDLMNVSLTYHADKMESLEHKFNNANLNVLIESISVESVKDLNEFVASFSSNPDALLDPINMKKLGLTLDKLLASDPVLKITDLSIETPQGKIESSLTVKIDKALFDITNTMSIMQALDAQANASVPEGFILHNDMMPIADMYVEQGLLRKENSELTFSSEFSKGQLTINGNIIPL